MTYDEMRETFMRRLQEDMEFLAFYSKPRTPPAPTTPRPGEPTEPGWYWARWDPQLRPPLSAPEKRLGPRSIVRVERELKWGRVKGQPEPPTELRVVDRHERFPLSAFSGWVKVVPPEDP